jgi:2'-5' RNA ligase
MPGIRTFIALPTHSTAQHAIAEIQTKLKDAQVDIKWESQDKFHITLVFLGNVEQSKLELLSTALAKSSQQIPSCTITYDTIGAFPNAHNPRVVWLGIKTNQTILDLQTKAERVCTEFGVPKDDRVFHPHITLGRVKETRNFVCLTDAIKTITFEPIEMHCSEILLMKSELHPSGSIYTILKSLPLHT